MTDMLTAFDVTVSKTDLTTSKELSGRSAQGHDGCGKAKHCKMTPRRVRRFMGFDDGFQGRSFDNGHLLPDRNDGLTATTKRKQLSLR